MFPKPISLDKDLRAYVVGLALGDGNLSNPNGRAQKLRITCDARYTRLAQRIAIALQSLLPQNKVSFVKKQANAFDIVCHSNHWEDLLGWKAGKGSKREQHAAVPKWIFDRESYKINCVRGLIETDGTIYDDRGYQMVMFCNTSPELVEDVHKLIRSLGFTPHVYRIERMLPHHTAYHVRLSRRVIEFLNLIRADKS